MATLTTVTLPLSVLRPADGFDCSRNGISAQHVELNLVGTCIDEGKIIPLTDGMEIGTQRINAPVLLKIRNLMQGTVATIIPAFWDNETEAYKAEPRWVMAGGNYAQSTDSRLAHLLETNLGTRFYGALSIHDRIETN